MDPVKDVLGLTADYAAQFLGSLDERPVGASATVEELRAGLGGPLPVQGTGDVQVIAELIAAAEPGVTAIPGGRYFGFVIGGSLPAALAADWLTSTWDQNAGLYVIGPSAAVVEEVALEWLRELLQLPDGVSAAFVTGCQMAHVTALAAARHHVLECAGWDLQGDGLQGAPRIRVLVGEQRHVTIDRALRYLGIGARQIEPLAADGQGRMRPEALRQALHAGSGPTIVCAQAGDVNSGCFDPLVEIGDAVEGTDAWLHVDGAFGLWASASPRLRHLTAGAERADSWATDGHKWLNVPYDSGIAFCAHPGSHRAAMSVSASYLEQTDPDAARDRAGLDAGVLPPRPRLPDLRRDPRARERRRRRHGRALLRPRRALRGAARRRARRRDPQRRRPEPGARPVRRRRRAHAGDREWGAGGRHLLALGDGLARQGGDADLGVELADERRRRRALGGGDPGSGSRGRRPAAGVVSPRDDLFALAADYAKQFQESLDTRRVGADASFDDVRAALGGPLPDEGREDAAVLHELIAAAEPGIVGSQTGRYFGFVFGGALPAAVAADWMATAWDQNGFSVVDLARRSRRRGGRGRLARRPARPPGSVSSGFVTGAQVANTTALAAARHHVLAAAGWDVERDGLAGAPPLRVVAGGERHVTIDRSLRLLGIGTNAVVVVPVDGQGRMRRRSRCARSSPGKNARRSSALRPAT